jgi:hypothetical protein
MAGAVGGERMHLCHDTKGDEFDRAQVALKLITTRV